MKEKVLKVKQALTQPLVEPAVYSSWIKLLRVSAWIRRFCHNVRNKRQRTQGILSVQELREAKLYWIEWAQRDNFPAD